MNQIDYIREALATYAHSSWTGWMVYLFSKCKKNEDGSIVIPPELVKRWEKQMNTSYVDLPEDEKESDRAEADTMLSVFGNVQKKRNQNLILKNNMKSDQEKFEEYLNEVAEALFNDLTLYDSSVPKEMRIFYIKRRFNQILNKKEI